MREFSLFFFTKVTKFIREKKMRISARAFFRPCAFFRNSTFLLSSLDFILSSLLALKKCIFNLRGLNQVDPNKKRFFGDFDRTSFHAVLTYSIKHFAFRHHTAPCDKCYKYFSQSSDLKMHSLFLPVLNAQNHFLDRVSF